MYRYTGLPYYGTSLSGLPEYENGMVAALLCRDGLQVPFRVLVLQSRSPSGGEPLPGKEFFQDFFGRVITGIPANQYTGSTSLRLLTGLHIEATRVPVHRRTSTPVIR